MQAGSFCPYWLARGVEGAHACGEGKWKKERKKEDRKKFIDSNIKFTQNYFLAENIEAFPVKTSACIKRENKKFYFPVLLI
jgi:hypothetical protein